MKGFLCYSIKRSNIEAKLNNGRVITGAEREREIQRLMDACKIKITPPKPGMTRVWLSECIILLFLFKYQQNIIDLLTIDACRPYIAPNISNIINNEQYWRSLGQYRFDFRLLHELIRKWQGDVSYNNYKNV